MVQISKTWSTLQFLISEEWTQQTGLDICCLDWNFSWGVPCMERGSFDHHSLDFWGPGLAKRDPVQPGQGVQGRREDVQLAVWELSEEERKGFRNYEWWRETGGIICCRKIILVLRKVQKRLLLPWPVLHLRPGLWLWCEYGCTVNRLSASLIASQQCLQCHLQLLPSDPAQIYT